MFYLIMINKPTQKNISGEWKLIALESLSLKISDGIHTTPKYSDIGNYYFINGNNLYNSKIIFSDDTKKVDCLEYLKHKKDLEQGNTILLSINGTIGSIAYYNNEQVVLGKSCAYIKLNSKVNVCFIFYFLNSYNTQRYFLSEVTGSTIKNLSIKSIKSCLVKLPPFPEQKRIVAVLETWDKAIEKLTKKIAVKKEIKKGLMQELLTGKTRLPGFKDKWETLEIRNIGKIVTGNTPSKKISDYYGGKYLWATALDFSGVYIEDTEIKLSELGRKVAREVPTGSVLVTCIASIGKNAIAKKPMSFNQQINAIIPSVNFDSEFIYYMVENSPNKLKEVAGNGAMAMISKSVFESIKLTFPKKDEQTAIANILTTTDNEIKTLQQKLSLLKDQKKYLLNNLITGAIRTPETLSTKNGVTI
ncbi:MAG: restriction endonuclease subunit S [Pseudomonadota bacterium]